MQEEAAILEADDRRIRACLEADGEVLDNLLAKQLRYTHSSGRQERKVEYIKRIVDRKTEYESIEASDRRVQLMGDAAILEGRVTFSIRAQPATRRVESLFLSVWTKESSSWQLLAWVSTAIATVQPNMHSQSREST